MAKTPTPVLDAIKQSYAAKQLESKKSEQSFDRHSYWGDSVENYSSSSKPEPISHYALAYSMVCRHLLESNGKTLSDEDYDAVAANLKRAASKTAQQQMWQGSNVVSSLGLKSQQLHKQHCAEIKALNAWLYQLAKKDYKAQRGQSWPYGRVILGATLGVISTYLVLTYLLPNVFHIGNHAFDIFNLKTAPWHILATTAILLTGGLLVGALIWGTIEKSRILKMQANTYFGSEEHSKSNQQPFQYQPVPLPREVPPLRNTTVPSSAASSGQCSGGHSISPSNNSLVA